MRKNLIILSILFSVMLNIGFIGAYCLHKGGLCSREQEPANHKRFLYEELNLSPEQLARFKPERDRFHSYLNHQGKRIQTKRLELIRLLVENFPDRKAINAKHEQIQTLQNQMQTKVIDHFLEEGSILTPGQRKKFFILIKGRIEKKTGSYPGWMLRNRQKFSQGKNR